MSQKQPATPIQSGEKRREKDKICLIGFINSTVKVQIVAEIFLSTYRLSKLEIQLNYGQKSLI
jgi:hypothetical protein